MTDKKDRFKNIEAVNMVFVKKKRDLKDIYETILFVTVLNVAWFIFALFYIKDL